MFGDGIGALNLYTKFNNRPLTENIWNKKGDQDNIWRLGTVSLSKGTPTESYSILFEGIKGKTDRGNKSLKYFYSF